MTPVEFHDQTMVYKKPENMTDEQCLSLPTKKCTVKIGEDEFPANESVWELSEEELKIVISSKRIRLQVLGQGMPPVLLIAEPKEAVERLLPEDPNEKLWPDSSVIKRTRHLPEENILEVEFNNGSIIHYTGFPAILWPDLTKTHSIGQFINKQIKGQFPFNIVNPQGK